MFGGNQTERRNRKERISSGVILLVFFFGFWWQFTTLADRTPTETFLFWGLAALTIPPTLWTGWKYRHASDDIPLKYSFAYVGAGLLLANLFEGLRLLWVVLGGIAAGFCIAGAVGQLLIVVFVRPPTTATREREGDTAGS